MLGKLIILLIRQLKVIFAAKTKKTLKFHLLLCARTQADKVPSVWGIASQMAAVNLKMLTLQKAVQLLLKYDSHDVYSYFIDQNLDIGPCKGGSIYIHFLNIFNNHKISHAQ